MVSIEKSTHISTWLMMENDGEWCLMISFWLVGKSLSIHINTYTHGTLVPMVESFMAHSHLPRSISEHFSWRKVLFWLLKQMAPWKWDAKQQSNKNQGSYSTCWGTHWKLAQNLNEFSNLPHGLGYLRNLSELETWQKSPSSHQLVAVPPSPHFRIF